MHVCKRLCTQIKETWKHLMQVNDPKQRSLTSIITTHTKQRKNKFKPMSRIETLEAKENDQRPRVTTEEHDGLREGNVRQREATGGNRAGGTATTIWPVRVEGFPCQRLEHRNAQSHTEQESVRTATTIWPVQNK